MTIPANISAGQRENERQRADEDDNEDREKQYETDSEDERRYRDEAAEDDRQRYQDEHDNSQTRERGFTMSDLEYPDHYDRFSWWDTDDEGEEELAVESEKTE